MLSTSLVRPTLAAFDRFADSSLPHGRCKLSGSVAANQPIDSLAAPVRPISSAAHTWQPRTMHAWLT